MDHELSSAPEADIRLMEAIDAAVSGITVGRATACLANVIVSLIIAAAPNRSEARAVLEGICSEMLESIDIEVETNLPRSH